MKGGDGSGGITNSILQQVYGNFWIEGQLIRGKLTLVYASLHYMPLEWQEV